MIVYLLAGAAVVCLWLLGLALCVAAAAGDRTADERRARADERKAQDDLYGRSF